MLAQRYWKIVILLGLVMMPSFVFLVAQARSVRGWDDWVSGSAQTMLTARYWARDGFVKHKLLFITSGYHPRIEIFDTPELRFLAKGTATGGLIGTRVWYTHYPSAYSIPYWLLAKIGIENRFWFRLFALGLSFSSVVFLFGFVYLITGRNLWIGLIGALYLVTSTTFLRFADSLNNTPVDDFFKWAILFTSIYAVEFISDAKRKKQFQIFIWLLYFLLAISSYDSTFFIFFWLSALVYFADIERRDDVSWFRRLIARENMRKYAFWISAPIIAFFVQIVQNVWYLGWKDAMLDFWGSFMFRASEIASAVDWLPPIIKNLANALALSGFLTDTRTRFVLPMIFALLYCLYKNEIISKKVLRYIFVLGIGGLLYSFFLPVAGIFGYQGRQVAPALLLVIAAATYGAILMIKRRKFEKWGIISAILISMIWIAHFKATATYAKEWPHNPVEISAIKYWEALHEISGVDTIVLNLNTSNQDGSNQFVREFYMDRLTLSFEDSDALLRYMEKINTAVSNRGDFLLILPKERATMIFKSLKDLDAYRLEVKSGGALRGDLIYIRAIHQ